MLEQNYVKMIICNYEKKCDQGPMINFPFLLAQRVLSPLEHLYSPIQSVRTNTQQTAVKRDYTIDATSPFPPIQIYPASVWSIEQNRYQLK